MKNERLGILFVILFSLVVLFLLILILSDEPLNAFYFFFAGPFRNIFSFGNMLNMSVPLILGALGIIIAMKAGNLNLGGEGQVYLGAFITTITALALSGIGFTGAIIAAVAGAACAGALSAISGICKAKWNVNELISSFLLSCAVLPIVNYLVQGPFLDPHTSLVSTAKIAENMRLPLILKPSSLNIGFFIALLFVFLVQYFLAKTRLGYELRMAGHNEMFARYGGINTKSNTVISFVLSGSLYGLAGGIAVLGTHYAVIKEFSAGLGWSGLTVALIACFSPAAVIPCALFLAWINTGARIAMQNTGLTFEIAYIVQAVIFLLSTSLAIRAIFNKKGKR
ncbi:MAG: ABC transporter permease [Treponema sp.]|nr:ABC transporter permease [Treponema sp.]MCL2230166.1 ABC transporter permease [Treponema sp.]